MNLKKKRSKKWLSTEVESFDWNKQFNTIANTIKKELEMSSVLYVHTHTCTHFDQLSNGSVYKAFNKGTLNWIESDRTMHTNITWGMRCNMCVCVSVCLLDNSKWEQNLESRYKQKH